MRIPARLRPKRPIAKPAPFRSIRFVTCLRCMGHGMFLTDPPESLPTVAFSQVGALIHLTHFTEERRLSTNQYAAVEREILGSSLPEDVPDEVKQRVNEDLSWEEKVATLASRGAAAPIHVSATDIAAAVHEFLLTSPRHPHLKTQ